jgi:hypothetical protein
MLPTIFATGIALVFLLFVILAFVFWIMMLVDCIKNRGLSSNERIVWVLVIVFLNWLGALIYLLAGRKK